MTALRVALERAAARGGSVEVVTAWSCPAPDDPGHEVMLSHAGYRWAPRVHADALARTRRHLETMPPLTWVVVEGDPSEVLTRASSGARCLVVGEHVPTPADDGGPTVAQRCLARAHCTVLVAA